MTMKNNKLISIIVPIYKVEKYLHICIDSIINQTYKNLEIILVDDGSPDNCGNICDEYAKNDERIIVIHKENGGLSDARNAGIDIAKGKYISFIDSDDFIDKNFIEKLYNMCEEYNCDIAEANYIRTKNEKILYQNINSKISIINSKEMIERLLRKSTYPRTIVVWNKLYKAELIKQYRFPKGKIHEDEFIMYKIFYENNIKIGITEDLLYYYRITPNSIMNKEFSKSRLDKLEAIEERLDFFMKNKEYEYYNRTLDMYASSILTLYILARNSNNDMQKELIEKFKSIYKDISNIKDLSILQRIRYKIAYNLPNLYYWIIILLKK